MQVVAFNSVDMIKCLKRIEKVWSASSNNCDMQ